MNASVVAVALGAALILLGGASAWLQLRGRQLLKQRLLVPSDEQAYLQGRYRRRLIAAGILILVGGMIAGAYLSGMEQATDAPKAETDAQGGKKPMTPEEKQLVRFWGVYWIVVVVLAFVLVCIALLDVAASRRYWLGVYRQMKEDHQVKLRRDLAVYRQQKDDRGAQRGEL